MNKIEKLIAEFCPEGVDFLSFDNVIISLRTGLNPRQNFKLNPPYAKNYYITVRELDGFDIRITDKTDRVDDGGLTLISFGKRDEDASNHIVPSGNRRSGNRYRGEGILNPSNRISSWRRLRGWVSGCRTTTGFRCPLPSAPSL